MEENNEAYRLMPIRVVPFLLGGNAVFTLLKKANSHYHTYSVEAPKVQQDSRNPVRFVSVKGGGGSWEPIGMIFEKPKLAYRMKANVNGDDPKVKGFKWLIDLLGKEDWASIDKYAVVMHVGMCSKCSRMLTNPDSIAYGIGPECRSRD
jgi:hypothetical protein